MGDNVISHVDAGRRITFGSICESQSESLGRRLVFHRLPLYGYDNATHIFRKFTIALLLNRKTISIRINVLESEGAGERW
jgi:hypothetical protein